MTPLFWKAMTIALAVSTLFLHVFSLKDGYDISALKSRVAALEQQNDRS